MPNSSGWVMKVSLVFLAMLMYLFLPVASVHAFDWHENSHTVLNKDQQSDGSFYTFGETVTIEGNVTGDLVCGAQEVTISGIVQGDVLCVAQTITITGTVKGDIRLAAQVIKFEGLVEGNAHLASQTLEFRPTSLVGGELAFWTQQANLAGIVDGDVVGAAEKIELTGVLGRNNYFTVADFRVSPEAKIAGNLNYVSDQAIVINRDQVKGDLAFRQLESPKPLPVRRRAGDWLGGRLGAIVSALILGLIAIRAMPNKVELLIQTIAIKPGRSLLYGFLTIVIMPLALAIVFLTLVGIPLALILAALFFVGVVSARLIPALWLGQQLAGTFKSKPSFVQAALIGIPVSWLAFGLPGWGFWLSVAATFIGLGAIIVTWRSNSSR